MGQAGSHSEGGAKLQGGRLSLVLHQLFQLLKLADHFTGMGKKKLSPFCEIKLFFQDVQREGRYNELPAHGRPD